MIYQIKSAPPFSCDFDKTNICHINIPIKRSLPVNSSKKYYVCKESLKALYYLTCTRETYL